MRGGGRMRDTPRARSQVAVSQTWEIRKERYIEPKGKRPRRKR